MLKNREPMRSESHPAAGPNAMIPAGTGVIRSPGRLDFYTETVFHVERHHEDCRGVDDKAQKRAAVAGREQAVPEEFQLHHRLPDAAFGDDEGHTADDADCEESDDAGTLPSPFGSLGKSQKEWEERDERQDRTQWIEALTVDAARIRSTRKARAMTMTPRGTLIRKIHRQLANPTMAPPRLGPTASPAATATPMSPSALPRSLRGKASVMMAGPVAYIALAPNPWNTRKPTSAQMDQDRAQASEPRVKTAKPAM